MEKSSGAFRSIGEMAGELGVKTHILRYWEEQFPMLRPLKRAGGRRHYRPADAILLHRINGLLNQEGYTIKGAVRYLSAAAPEASPGDSPPRETSAVEMPPTPSEMPLSMEALRSIRQRLAAALDAA